jgi:hypothetical protein
LEELIMQKLTRQTIAKLSATSTAALVLTPAGLAASARSLTASTAFFNVRS